MQRLASDVSCDAELEQRLINAGKEVLGFMITIHLKAVKFQNSVSKSFRGSFAWLVHRLQILFT